MRTLWWALVTYSYELTGTHSDHHTVESQQYVYQLCISITRLVYPLVYPHGKFVVECGGTGAKMEFGVTKYTYETIYKNMTCDHTHVIMGIWYG